tara:strand:- start:1097 stop:1381 length:285 start_codon:yes stop_codon:yes gene_type:complete
MTPNEKIESRQLRVAAGAWQRALQGVADHGANSLALLACTDALRAMGARYSDLVHLANAAGVGRAAMDAALEQTDHDAAQLPDYDPRADVEVQP